MNPSPASGTAAALLLVLTGCSGILLPNKVPLERLELASGSGGDCLVILLPGRFGGPKDYAQADFARWAREAGVAADLVAVDAHIGYYRDRSVVDRLHQDVVLPARAAGYREIWLAGASMGGLGSLLYLRQHGDELAGVLALAPFLGDDELLDAIRAQGGPRTWRSEVPADDASLEGLWVWLQQQSVEPPPLPIYLAWGTDDDLAPADRLLAELLPAERISTTPGGHDWDAWAELWRWFLAEGAACQSRPSNLDSPPG